jgi:hypothetical protein
MKNLQNYIVEVSSLYDTWSGSTPSNWLDYHDGDKKFSELQVGDVVYYHTFDTMGKSSGVVEFNIKSAGIKTRKNTAYLSVEPIKLNKFQTITQLEFGPTNGGAGFGPINGVNRYYSFGDVADSSVCISIYDDCVFGTNREIVLNIAKSNVGSRIEKINKQIDDLNKSLGDLNAQLQNLI